ncbi:MAG: (2Fe-2S)-binding protein [Microbacteriaceae bacterium]|jgi:nitrite reductase/ring-hydroxylating ferredoxin subunit/uncharacterized membrane protein|nr:(2Fe-2S)-binding protein [Microbacteriaceae bacterium]
MNELAVLKPIDRLEDAAALDPLIRPLRRLVKSVIRPRAVRDVLHGVPFGHPVHPIAVQIPIGAWTSAAVLDALPGNRGASRVLVAVGVAAALPAAVTGMNDWSQLHQQQARVGVIHWAANFAAVGLYAVSFVQRSRGRDTSGKVFGYLGLAVVSFSGFLGGHLSYRQAAGANHAEDVPHRFPRGWQSLAPLEEIPENELISRTVGGLPLLVLRRGDSVSVLSNVCSHLSGPLNRGRLVSGHRDDPCVECPWHGSVFSLNTGEVVHGPATAPLPRFDTRVTDGLLEVQLQRAR